MRWCYRIALIAGLMPLGALAETLPHGWPGDAYSFATEDCGVDIAAANDGRTGEDRPTCLPLVPVDLPSSTPLPTREALRGIIRGGDQAAVAAALDAAWLADQSDPKGPMITRDLFQVFTDLDPATDTFTKAWVETAPDDAFALAARGWQLLQQGWTWRGQASLAATWPHRVSTAEGLHKQAAGLMRRALALNPDLLPAAEGMLRLSPMAVAPVEMVPVLERAMQVYPNRDTLMLAMTALSPQWGGTQVQVDLLCARYAPMIPAEPAYDAETCKIDAAYFVPYVDGPRFQAARAALMRNDSPWLEVPRQRERMLAPGSAEEKIAALQAAQAERPLFLEEARLLDDLQAQVTGAPASPDQAAFAKAATYWVAEYRRWADNAPLAPTTLQQLVIAYQADQQANAAPYPAEEVRDRALAVLGAFPEDPAILQLAAEAIVTVGTAPEQSEDQKLPLAEPYFINAIVYSGYDPAVLSAAVDPKLRLLEQKWIRIMEAGGDIPPRDLPAEMDQDLICPAIRQLKLLVAACTSLGRVEQGCGQWEAGIGAELGLSDYAQAGHCAAEFDPKTIAELQYVPMTLKTTAPD